MITVICDPTHQLQPSIVTLNSNAQTSNVTLLPTFDAVLTLNFDSSSHPASYNRTPRLRFSGCRFVRVRIDQGQSQEG